MTVIDIRIELKKGVADPEGSNTMKTLEALGFKGIKSVKSVKTYVVDLDMPADEAQKAGEEYCRKLLANPVVQSYTVTVRRSYGPDGEARRPLRPLRREDPGRHRRRAGGDLLLHGPRPLPG
ncbi:MAG: phosphoribosylformylglycinamidine synthase subunit PurS [Methanomethylophilus sp.]|jgi:phosphoribosylformylglycinamidine synthase